MTNTEESGKRCDTDSSGEGVTEVDNRYGRRGNTRGPIKPVHNRGVNTENVRESNNFAYEPVNRARNDQLMHTPDRRHKQNDTYMSVDRRDNAYERVNQFSTKYDEPVDYEPRDARYGFSDSRSRPVSQGDMLIAAKQKR